MKYSFHDNAEMLNSLRSALRLLEMGLYDRLGTDAHRPRKLADWPEKGLKVIELEIGKEELKKLVSMPVGRLLEMR